MEPSDIAGRVQTVTGLLTPDQLGIVLPHEHLLIDMSLFPRYTIPEIPEHASDRNHYYEPVSLENLWWVRYHWNNLDNWRLLDTETAVREALLYKREGGRTIVDATIVGIGRNPSGLVQIARKTGLNIIMGTGYYVDGTYPPNMDTRTEDELAGEMVREITVGINGTDVRAGIIGELGNSWPWTSNEQKVVRAAARAQRIAGASVTIHPARHERSPFAIIETMTEAGADINRVIMCHIDRTLLRTKQQLQLAKTGCYMEFDMFGVESSYYPYAPIDIPSDAQKIDHIINLINEGHLKKILVSHDVCKKIQLTKYGGYGYGHILRNVVPIMRRKGISEDQISTILVENPARLLTFT